MDDANTNLLACETDSDRGDEPILDSCITAAMTRPPREAPLCIDEKLLSMAASLAARRDTRHSRLR
jgi:hypothetical protein